ncbi:hypothetical protein GCM10009624_12310 [Gordonia sinesedis]
MIGPPTDLSGRGPGRRALSVWGIVALGLVVVVTVPLFAYARGAFDERVSMTLVSDRIADSLRSGADVKYRGLLIGRVESTEVGTDGRQRVRLSMDAGQARSIDGGLSARFAPSNIFGVVGIELEPTPSGPRMRDGAVVTMTDDSTQASAITVLRDVGTITRTLTGDDFSAMVNRLDTVIDQITPLVSAGFELFNLAHERQRMPFADVLRISADTLRGADSLGGPFVDMFTTLVEKTELYADPEETERVTGALTGLVQTFITLGQVVGTNPGDLATVVDASLTIGAPLGYTLSTVPRAADGALVLLDGLERSMPVVDGRVRLRLGVTLTSLPQITSVLAATERPGG